MIDVLFILLFALLAMSEARSSTEEELIHIRLPNVEPGEGNSSVDDLRLVIEIDASSLVSLRATGAAVNSAADLEVALANELGDALPEDIVVEIQADRDARHGVAVELLQHLRNRGFVNVQLIAVGYEGDDGLFGGPR